jgi:uncharacterized protein (TIGR00290 family)
MTTKTLLSWSSGKDAAWALRLLRREPAIELVGLLTTVNETYERVAMHGVRERLLELQAEAAGLPLWKIPLPWPCSNDVYESRMAQAMNRMQTEGINAVAYGDLFLPDIRAYRESRHAGTGIAALFPLWGRDTSALAREMIAEGLQARLACVDTSRLDACFAGRAFDLKLLEELPTTVDPCGEHGEFHTFAWDGPMFRHPIPVDPGDVVVREGFAFADLLPNSR